MYLRVLFILTLSFLISSCNSPVFVLTEKQTSEKSSNVIEGPIIISTSVPNALIDTATPIPTPTPTITPVPAFTLTITSTPASTPTITPTISNTPKYSLVDVYFVDKARLENNLPDVEVAGVRWTHSDNQLGKVLDEYFEGPSRTERYSYGLIGIYNGFTGYSKFEITHGMARLYLTGTCERTNLNYTIADILTYNLKQFPEIQYVKIYDQNGVTQDPFGLSDSVPGCLQP